MADEDNFDIDIYGDEAPENVASKDDTLKEAAADEAGPNQAHAQDLDGAADGMTEVPSNVAQPDTQPASNTNGVAQQTHQQDDPPQDSSAAQGTKRKEGHDDRPVDQGASSALVVSGLQWWNNEDDIRGWTNQAECEDELRDITFSEHKVNGKSKGEAYLEFVSAQAATATKRKIDAVSADMPVGKRPNVSFHSSVANPFRTLPKDAPARAASAPRGGGQGSYERGGGFNNNYRGRGGAANRGAMTGGFNRGGGFQGGMNAGGFNAGNQMGGFGGMNGMGGGFTNNNNNNFNRGGMRGGMGNMRGGRGGMGGGMSMMGGMPMGGMGMQMAGMPMMNMGAMPGGFGGNQGHFNPAFFHGQQQQQQQMGAAGGQGGDNNWNPHGAKRPRPE